MNYPHISEKDVLETVNFYNNHPDFISPTPGKTVEEFIGNLNKRAKKDTDGKLEKALMTYHANADLLDDESLEIVRKLLDNKKIREKIRIVDDGSYLVNRIWNCIDAENGKIVIIPEFDGHSINVDSSEFYKLSAIEKIDWLYNHFDIIYAQISLVETRQEMEEEINFGTWLEVLEKYDY